MLIVFNYEVLSVDSKAERKQETRHENHLNKINGTRKTRKHKKVLYIQLIPLHVPIFTKKNGMSCFFTCNVILYVITLHY